MTSRNSKRFAAPSQTVGLIVTALLVLGSVLTARAQSEGAGANSGLEGTWHLQLSVRNCETGTVLRSFPALAAFSKGGTLALTTAGQLPSLSTTGLGVWRHTQGHSYSAVSESFLFSPAGAWIQTHRLTRAIDIGDDGDSFTDTVALEIFDPNGNLIAQGCATSVASRFK